MTVTLEQLNLTLNGPEGVITQMTLLKAQVTTLQQQQQQQQRTQQQLQTEMGRRAAEHEATHNEIQKGSVELAQQKAAMEQLHGQLQDAAARTEEAMTTAHRAATEAQEAHYELQSGGGGRAAKSAYDPMAGDRAKKLDRFATDRPTCDTFGGEKQGAGLRHWVKEFRGRARYAALALETALEKSERREHPITPDDLQGLGIDRAMDEAIHMGPRARLKCSSET